VLEALADDRFAPCLDDPGADEKTSGTKVLVAHPQIVVLEVLGFLAQMTTMIAVEELLQQHAAHAVHGAAYREFGGFQVRRLAAPTPSQEVMGYLFGLAGGFCLDDLGNFFFRATRSPVSCASSNGRC